MLKAVKEYYAEFCQASKFVLHILYQKLTIDENSYMYLEFERTAFLIWLISSEGLLQAILGVI